MIKKILLGIAFVAIVAALVIGAVQRTSATAGEGTMAGGRPGGKNGASQGTANGQSAGNGQSTGGMEMIGEEAGATGETAVQHVDTTALIPGSLSEEEIAGLVYMREEEKLARDVYLALYTLWGQPTFQNIASSEQSHMDALLDLLQNYGVTDPAGEQGKFTNPDLQALYDQLVAQGSQSLVDALKVGAAIEEIDILDLRERAALTDEAAIQTVYASLESGSENHLRAFTSTLASRSGETYQPQYMSAADYQAIVGSTGSQGDGNGHRGGR